MGWLPRDALFGIVVVLVPVIVLVVVWTLLIFRRATRRGQEAVAVLADLRARNPAAFVEAIGVFPNFRIVLDQLRAKAGFGRAVLGRMHAPDPIVFAVASPLGLDIFDRYGHRILVVDRSDFTRVEFGSVDWSRFLTSRRSLQAVLVTVGSLELPLWVCEPALSDTSSTTRDAGEAARRLRAALGNPPGSVEL